MGFSTLGSSSQKLLNDDLLNVGNCLLTVNPSSIDDLLTLLQKTGSVLARIWQQPPISTSKSLLPVMKTLASDKFLKHDDLRIQIALAYCMNELTRISAPKAPYPDNVMKVIFELLMVPIKYFSSADETLRILEYMARVKSCVLMIDIASENTIVEMFHLFLNTIRCDRQSVMFDYMQMIMTMIIEESDEISFDLLKPLLASVRMDTKNISPCSWKLGRTIFEKCASKLRPYVREAVMNLDVRDYADVVSALCQDTPNRNITMVGSSLSTSLKTKKRKSLNPPKEKKNKKVLTDDRERLVDSRIQVWWPMDEMFYAGTVTAFDHTTKRHTVRYDDNEIENLLLEKEIWKPLNDESKSKVDSELLNIMHTINRSLSM